MVNFRIADITGQSLPILEDLDFACFDDPCCLSHLPPRRTSSNELSVNCAIVVLEAMLPLANAIRLSVSDARGELVHGEPHDWIGAQCMLRQRVTQES